MNKLDRRHFMLGASPSALEATRVMGANDRIGVAVAGCGMRGLLGEVLQFSKESNVEVTGVCDLETAARKSCRKREKDRCCRANAFHPLRRTPWRRGLSTQC
jgi:hypothetical protein